MNNLYASQSNFDTIPQPPEKAPNTLNTSPRYLYWLGLFVCSLIVVGTTIEATDRVHATNHGVRNQKWAVALSMVSFGMSLLVVCMHMSPVAAIFIVGTRLEAGICMFLIGVWIGLVVAITDAGSGLAVDDRGAVVFGNLYYFSWFGFLGSVTIMTNYLRNVFYLELTEEMSVRADRMNLWVATAVCNLVFMASAANVQDYSCSNFAIGSRFCNRSLLALLVGFGGSAFSILIVGMKVATGFDAPLMFEFSVSALLFLVNCFTLALVTSEEGPGGKIGNLYYFSWLALILPFLSLASCYEFMSGLEENAAPRRSSFFRRPTLFGSRSFKGPPEGSVSQGGAYYETLPAEGGMYYGGDDDDMESVASMGLKKPGMYGDASFKKPRKQGDDYGFTRQPGKTLT